jgi:hypothetical protein
MASKPIQSLLQRRDDLLKQLSEINTQVVRHLLDSGAAAAAMPGGIALRGGRMLVAGGKGRSRRKWFERGEMIRLSKKIVTQPMSQADLVRALSTAKGYDKGLATADKARFKSAAYQAIAAALEAKQLFRNKQGQVSTRRA